MSTNSDAVAGDDRGDGDATVEHELPEELMARLVNRWTGISVLTHVRSRHLLASAVPVTALLLMRCSSLMHQPGQLRSRQAALSRLRRLVSTTWSTTTCSLH